MIPYGRQSISDADIAAVEAVLKSDWLTQGATVPRFEQTVSEYTGANYATAVNSGTSALHIACLALRLGPGDRLWTSPNSFAASANCALYCGAGVDFVDIDPRTYNMSVDALRQKLADAERTGTLPKIVVPVHFAGQSCDMRQIKDLSERYGFHTIEDASHAIGGRYLGERVGNCSYSDITVFSFHPVKIVTTGEGGMAVTIDLELHERMQRLRSHGITHESDLMDRESHGPWYYQQIELGFNYRMTDIQAALGASQMQRVDTFVTNRRRLAARYDELLSKLPIVRPWQCLDAESAWHLYVIRLCLDRVTNGRRAVFEALRTAGIGVQVHYIPVHTHPHYRQLGFSLGDFPECERYYAEAITLPLYATLTEREQDEVMDALVSALG